MKVPAFTFVALLLIGSAYGQTEPKPYSRQAAEKSFQALVAAKDSDIMDIVKNDGYVCFADEFPIHKEDRFLTIVLPKPTAWFPEKSTDDKDYHSLYDETKESPAISFASLDFYEWENQDYNIVVTSVLDGNWHSYGHFQRLKDGKTVWKPFSDTPPIFRFATNKDAAVSGATSASAMQDGTIFSASKKYENKNNGTTVYEMNMRLSTGRYKETWTPDKGEPFESVGNCYKAKDYIRSSAPVKKAK